MFDKKKFKAKVIIEGKTLLEVANFLEINIATLHRKMNGESDFFRDEIQKLKEFLDIEDPNEIFFAEKIA